MDTLVQTITIAMLGLGDPGFDSSVYSAVRIAWQQQGQPFSKIDEDVAYVRAVEVDDQYNRVRDRSYVQPDADTFTELNQYTRVWEIHWTLYGPNSFDHARMIRSALFTQDIHDQFAQAELYLITDPTAPTRVPEEMDAQWWERVDFSARFNEFVTESATSQSVLSTEVIIETKDGIISDVEVFGVSVSSLPIPPPPIPVPPPPPSGGSTVTRYSLTPSPDGSTTSFSTSPVAVNISPNAIVVRNGLVQSSPGDYSTSGTLVIFVVAPDADDTLGLFQ